MSSEILNLHTRIVVISRKSPLNASVCSELRIRGKFVDKISCYNFLPWKKKRGGVCNYDRPAIHQLTTDEQTQMAVNGFFVEYSGCVSCSVCLNKRLSGAKYTLRKHGALLVVVVVGVHNQNWPLIGNSLLSENTQISNRNSRPFT